MKGISPVLILLKLFLLFGIQMSSVYATGTAEISENGKKATLTLPLTALVSVNNIMNDTVTVIPLSSVYENVKWDTTAKKLLDHHFLLRVIRNGVKPLIYEVINDAYTCGLNNPNRLNKLLPDISVVNDGYKYSVTAGTNNYDLGVNRSATIDEISDWQPVQGTSDYFIDLTLNITFPDVSKRTGLMSRGGFCRGSVTMLVSAKLE